MVERNFEEWLATMTDAVADWTYYTDFKKVYDNVETIKIPLNILNSLIGSQQIKDDFEQLYLKYPEILYAIPILIAKRLKDTIIVKDATQDFYFKFSNVNQYTVADYTMFLEKTGIFDLLSNRLISNLVDYVTGVEVGMDTNGRKNRTGQAMENIVESYIQKAGFIKDVSYFKEMYQNEVENKFDVDLSTITNDGNTSKRFDFVVKTKEMVYLIEVNFYATGGSKLNETARSYKMITEEAKAIPNVKFVWITDGQGWNQAKKNLRETFDVLEDLYNIKELKENILLNSLK